jgi:hypothetical protein
VAAVLFTGAPVRGWGVLAAVVLLVTNCTPAPVLLGAPTLKPSPGLLRRDAVMGTGGMIGSAMPFALTPRPPLPCLARIVESLHCSA